MSTKKVMLITGASRGIGKACSERFQERYELVSVARSSGDFRGDLADESFRRKILNEVSPDVFINNAGLAGGAGLEHTLGVNFVAAAELLLEFQKKMSSGVIVNVLSTAMDLTYRGMSEAELLYYSSKSALSSFSKLLQGSQQNQVRITNLEVGFVMTDFANIKRRYQAKSDIFGKTGITPMEPEYVAEVIDWVLAQPSMVTISNLKITNRPVGPS